MKKRQNSEKSGRNVATSAGSKNFSLIQLTVVPFHCGFFLRKKYLSPLKVISFLQRLPLYNNLFSSLLKIYKNEKVNL
jgi:hypothetical protein